MTRFAREVAMKKILFVGALVLLSLSACVPDFLNSSSEAATAAPVDIMATVEDAANTQAAQTLEAIAALTTLATPTLESPTDEPTATTTEVVSSTETATPTLTETPDGTLTITETPDGTLPAETATETPDGTLPADTATATLEVTSTSVFPSPTSPISINEPPASVPRYKIDVKNTTKVRVYISLQGSSEGGYNPIIEYDLAPWERIKLTVPEGYYASIVYVGKDPMINYFGVYKNNSVTIAISKDSVKVSK